MVLVSCGPSRPPGGENGPCYSDGTCDPPLVCVSQVCEDPCGDGICGLEEDETTCPQECQGTTVDVFAQALNNQADILFMVDNSNSMEPNQTSLMQYFPNFMNPLKALDSKPDLHIGIVTSDMGAGQFTPPSCPTVGGSKGILQNTPNGDTCASASLTNPGDRYLAYAEINGSVQTNFSGDIGDAFGCYAAVGTGGCGFEHQLASVRAALDGCNTAAGCTQRANVGFFRPDAYLAVIVLTNEDDCSAPMDSTLFDPSQTKLQSQLGPLTSYRCFEFGNLCNGAPPGRNQGPRQGCEPGVWDKTPEHQLIPTEELATFLKTLKPDPRMVYVSVIGPPPNPVQVGVDTNGYPDLQPACTGSMGTGDAAPRLNQFITYFDSDRASYISVCANDLNPAMSQIAEELSKIFGHQCLAAPLKDKDLDTDGLQPNCAVADRVAVDAAAEVFTYTTVPPCDPVVCDPATAPGGDCKCAQHTIPDGTPGCWYVWQNPDPCGDPAEPSYRSGYEIKIDRGTDAACNNPQPPLGTVAAIKCASCIAQPDEDSYDCSEACSPYWPEHCR